MSILFFALACSELEGTKCRSRPSLYQIKKEKNPEDISCTRGVLCGAKAWGTTGLMLKITQGIETYM